MLFSIHRMPPSHTHAEDRRRRREPERTGAQEEPRRGREFERHLPHAYRDLSSSRERANLLARLQPAPPGAKLKFGDEVESKDIHVVRKTKSSRLVAGGKRGEVVADLPGCQLEIDTNLRNDQAYVEFVNHPTGPVMELISTCRNKIAAVNGIRQKAMTTKNNLVPVTEVFPDARAEKRDRYFDLKTVTPKGRLQPTFGIPFRKFDEAIDRLTRKRARRPVHEQTKAVEKALSKLCPRIPISENLHGFIEATLYYIYCMDKGYSINGTVHALFTLMHRGDFHSAYLKRLPTREDRALARILLLAKGRSKEPLLLNAIGRKASQRVFRNPYPDNSGIHGLNGLTYETWFKSIVYGDRRGMYGKDSTSPPAGFPAHTENIDDNYGMGGWGLFDDDDLLPIESRGREGRKDVLLNSHMLIQEKIELKIAAYFNPEVLGNPDDIIITGHEREWLRDSDAPITALGEFRAKFRSKLDNGQRRAARKAIRNNKFQALRRFQKTFKERQWDQKYSKLDAALKDFFARVKRIKHGSPANFTGEPFSTALDKLINIMWDIDPTLESEALMRARAQPPAAPAAD
jgi:hypothetical protein